MTTPSSPKAKGVADMVFLLDATGSMGPCIDALKENIHSFLSTLTTHDDNNPSPVKDWRAKVVGFRDFDFPNVPPLVDHPFVRTVPELKEQLGNLEAKGGVDEAESLLEALYAVASMSQTDKAASHRPECWRHRTEAKRFVIVFTDAPFKDPLTVPKGATLDDVVNLLMNQRIILHVFAPDISCFGPLCEVDRAEWHVVTGGEDAQESLERFTRDRSNFRKILEQLAKTVSGTADVPEM